MRRIVILLPFFLLFFTGVSTAQRFNGEIIAGMNLSQVDGDEVYGYTKFGANTGLGVMLPFSFKKNGEQNWAVSMEMLWHQKGSYKKNRSNLNFCDTCPDETPCDPDIKYRLQMDYVSLPVMLHYTDPHTNWTFGVGVAYNRLFRIREMENGVRTSASLSNGPYTLTDYDALVDVRFRIYQRLKFNFRYEYSIVPIRTRRFYKPKIGHYDQEPWDRNQYHNILTFRLIYVFNEPKD
jgi:hypothetical protein